MSKDKLSILLIDDDSNFLGVVGSLLEDRYEVFPSTCAAEAYELLNKRPMDLIICDIWMSGKDGAEFASEIKTKFPDLPILMITGNPKSEALVRLINLKVDGLLEKPFQIEDLQEKIEQLTSLSDSKAGQYIKCLEIEIDRDRKEITFEGKVVKLTPTEYKILNFFLIHKGKRLCRDQILSEIWPETKVSNNVFDTHLSNLRKKIPTLQNCLRALYGDGYFLEV